MSQSKKGQHQYTFSKKTDMSVDKAKQHMKEVESKGPSQKKRRAMSTFVQKLYRDDDELNDLKVLAGDGNFDSDVEDEQDRNKASGSKAKRQSKQAAKQDGRSLVSTIAKVGKLKLEKGSVAMFAVSEVYPGQYAIVNHTRNVKGYIGLKERDWNLRVGQLVIAYVQATGTDKYLTESSGHLNRKLQLSLDPKLINRALTVESITTAMILQGTIETVESKGYMVDLGLKDKARAFVKFDKKTRQQGTDSAKGKIAEGTLVHVVVQGKTSKLIRCSLLEAATNEEEDAEAQEGLQKVKTDLATVTPHTLKPGFVVSAKVQKLYENGVEVTFLGGMTGTVFADHLAKSSATKYKLGEKVQAVVISQDIASKATALSMLPSLITLKNLRRVDGAQALEMPCAVGQIFNDVRVERKVFGNSYQLRLQNSPMLLGMLHKSNIPKPEDLLAEEADQADEETKDLSSDDAKKRAKAIKKKTNKSIGTDKDNLLEVGSTVPIVRVKEFNFFDRMPILSMLPQVVQAESLDYKTLTVGAIHQATIEKVIADEANKRVILKIGDFVKGVLSLDHMADHPLKVIPPKFTQIGKQIKVRVFSVNQLRRAVELTKKDTLMKESVPIATSYNDVRPGTAVYGVVVGETEHGFVIKSFAGLKGLLRHDDVKQHGAKKLKTTDLKPGHALKCYCMFVKKGSGIALTLSKKKVKGDTTGAADDQVETLVSKYLPSVEECESWQQSYGNLMRTKPSPVLDVATYKVCESRSNYHIVKTLDGKKPKIAILPKCLATSMAMARPFDKKDYTFEALTIAHWSPSDSAEENSAQIAILCAKPELISLKEEFRFNESERQSFVGLVESVSGRSGVTLRFSNGLTKLVALRDVTKADSVTDNYSVGQVVRAAIGKTGRLSLKRAVIGAVDSQASKRDGVALLHAFDKIQPQNLDGDSQLAIGAKIQGKVQLVKDYGLIVQLSGKASSTDEQLLGFIVNEQKAKIDKVYKAGESKLDCVVLDIDREKKMVDLSERLYTVEETKAAAATAGKKKGQSDATFQKAVVELNKEQYLVVTLKGDRSKIAVCMLQDLTAESFASYSRYSIGDEIEVKLVPSRTGTALAGKFLLAQPRQAPSASQTGGAYSGISSTESLQEGTLVTGTLKSMKGMCAFIQVGSIGKVPIIGRLHRVETSIKRNEFEQMKPGDRIESKILKKMDVKGRTMIELTRRPEHMKADVLNEDLCKLLSLDTLTNGQEVEGLISDVVASEIATKVSCPVQVQVSPYVHSSLLFSDLLDAEALLESPQSIGEYISSTYKTGKRIKLVYSNGKFQVGQKKASSAHQKGDLAVVRFVKAIKGFGVTVQLDAKTFGSIELCELTDDITGNVALEAQKQGIFVARIIGQDKKGRIQLSARASVLDDASWRLIKPEGTSGKFVQADQQRQEQGNLRNKVLKFGAALTFKQGDLTVGYIANISKAGCFIQVAHNVTMRAGLNELSDDPDYDFISQLPLGRVCLARVTRASDNNTRFDCSLRRSLIVYGVHQVVKSSLKPSTRLPCLILATSADNVSFGQVKGSYHKLKIKETPEGATAGQLCIVELSKIATDKLVGTFQEWVTPDEGDQGQAAIKERQFAQMFASVAEETRQDIIAARQQKEKAEQDGTAGEPDIEKLVENKRKQTQIEEQIRDLQMLNAEEGQDDDEDDQDMVNSQDSDADDMKRIQQQQEREYESSEDEKQDDAQMSEQEGESEEGESDQDDLMPSDSEEKQEEDGSSSEGAKKQSKKSGKKALRAQLEIEKTIRAKEAQMRSADGAAPTSVNDFERLLVADYDQSYLWIQYMAFMLENLDAEAARRVAERAVKQVSMTAEDDKLNLWIAFMNLESKFGTELQLQEVVKRALDVNDRRKVYLQLISIYRANGKVQYVEDIYKKLCKKYFESLEIWSGYIDFLFDMRGKDGDFTEPKTILQRALQALPKSSHVNVISKFGMLEFKNGNPEHGRTMFEGIVSNYPKRMDIWAIYMDMEVKYGGGKANQAQSRHLFERCLSLAEINTKPKKMKLVFRKYMEFENSLGNQNKLGELRTRVEKYLESAFKNGENSSEQSGDEGEVAAAEKSKDVEMEEEASGSEGEEDSGDDAEEGEEEMDSSSDGN